jgi:hypothetical protein
MRNGRDVPVNRGKDRGMRNSMRTEANQTKGE